MQTYFLSTNLEISASELDNRRLSKQLVEAMQIYNGNFADGPTPGNPHAYTMWLNYPQYLIYYGYIHYLEWQQRLKDGLRGGKLEHKSGEEFVNLMLEYPESFEDVEVPYWLTEEFVSIHRSVLLGKAWEAKKDAWQELQMASYEMIDAKPPGKWINACKVLGWYQSHNWNEKPAKRNSENKWSYIWPESASNEAQDA